MPASSHCSIFLRRCVERWFSGRFDNSSSSSVSFSCGRLSASLKVTAWRSSFASRCGRYPREYHSFGDSLGAPTSPLALGDGVFFTVVGGPTGTSARLLFPAHQRWDGFFEWGAEFFERPGVGFAGGLDGKEWICGDGAEAGVGDFSGFEEILGLGGVFGRDGDDDARLAFVEEGDVGAGAGDCGFGSEVPTHAGFREVDG